MLNSRAGGIEGGGGALAATAFALPSEVAV
jgi:hypothetical protein